MQVQNATMFDKPSTVALGAIKKGGCSSEAESFLSAIAAASVSDDSAKTESMGSITIKEDTPLEHFQRMAAETATAHTMSQSRWTDRQLAFLIGGTESDIDTTKKINWDSNGEMDLTAEQIALLKEKYDVTNLSPQEYYDLMSDLTNWNVLSGDDCIGVHFATFSGGPSLGPANISTFQSGKYGFQTGNMIKILSADLDLFLEYWDWVSSDEYVKINGVTKEDHDMAQTAVQKDIQVRRNMLNLMNQLR